MSKFAQRQHAGIETGVVSDLTHEAEGVVRPGEDGGKIAFVAGALPGERIAYIHVAGHYDEAEDLKVDTHGAPVKSEVWALLAEAYRRFGPRPTLLERDFNFPPYAELAAELGSVRRILPDGTIAPPRHARA